ncbi:MAG: NAD-dependent epimerase/dehydratase family protein [Thermodesulfobacteriota bacterium]|nr:NAD-dependent epimerase/dehydratase family protein [Thermodesulfobacteriota bacterium]
MKTLITGASGFVGSAVLRQLLHAGHDMRVLVRPTSDLLNITGLAVETVTGDLLDTVSLDRALAGCDALFHVAADYRLWVPKQEEIYKTNVNGTLNIMLAAARAGVKRIVYTSSVATLGLNQDESPAHEATPVTFSDMIGHYKRSKFLAEAEVIRLVNEQGLPAVIVNPSTPIGPRDIKPTPTGQMILQAVSGRMPAYVDTGLNLVHVDDVAIGHLLAFDHGGTGQRYILGANNMTLKEILSELSIIARIPSPRLRLPHNLILPFAYLNETYVRMIGNGEPLLTVDGVRLAKKKMFFSIEKAKQELGYRPRQVSQALLDAVDWFRQHGYLS